jgi:hypothetical protein
VCLIRTHSQSCEVGLAVAVDRDKLAVEHGMNRQLSEEADVFGHVQPRRLRTRSGPEVETIARNPSDFNSYA